MMRIIPYYLFVVSGTFLSFLFNCSSNHAPTKGERRRKNVLAMITAPTPKWTGDESYPTLVTTICQDQFCSKDCTTFVTPIGECYNPHVLFPLDDESWSEFDFWDLYLTGNELGHGDEILRTIFPSTNASCLNNSNNTKPNDTFLIPLNECVGPFGAPRPWGKLELQTRKDQGGRFQGGEHIQRVMES